MVSTERGSRRAHSLHREIEPNRLIGTVATDSSGGRSVTGHERIDTTTTERGGTARERAAQREGGQATSRGEANGGTSMRS